MASALFALHASKGSIKKSKSGSFKLVLDKPDREHTFFADRPDRFQGTLTSQQLIDQWDSAFFDSAPNSALSFQDENGKFHRVIFEQFKPRIKQNGNRLVSKISPLTSESNQSNDILTGLRIGKTGEFRMENPSVIIDDYTISTFKIINNTDWDLSVSSFNGNGPGQGESMGDRSLPKRSTLTNLGATNSTYDWDITSQISIIDYGQTIPALIIQAENPKYSIWEALKEDPFYDVPKFQANNSGQTVMAPIGPKDDIFGHLYPSVYSNVADFSWGAGDYPATLELRNLSNESIGYHPEDWEITINPITAPAPA